MEKIKIFYKNEYFLLAIILLIAFILRLVNLAIEPFWGDEIFTLGLTKYFANDFSGLLSYLHDVFIYPPLYLVLQKYWVLMFGYGESAVRFLSLIFGIVTILVVYYFIKRIFNNKKFALLCSFFVAILPMQIEFSQEARSYIMMTFFGIITVFSFWLYNENKNYNWLILFLSSSLLGFFSHYSFIILLISIYSWWIFKIIFTKKQQSKQTIIYLLTVLLITVVAFPWIETLISQSIHITQYDYLGHIRGVDSLRPHNIFETTLNNLIWTCNEYEINNIEIIAAGIFKIILFFCIIFIFLKINNQYITKNKNQLNHKALIYLFYIFSSCLLIFIFFPQSNKYVPLFEKHIIYCSVIGVILIAYFIFQFNKKIRLFLIILFVISLMNYDIKIIADDSLWSHYYNDNSNSKIINELYQEGDLILIYTSFGRTILNYYLDNDISAVGYSPLLILDDDWQASRYTLGFLENQLQFRNRNMTSREERIKYRYIMKKYNPRRIWLVEFPPQSITPQLLLNQGWQQKIKPVSSLMNISLFEQKNN
jgi:uncharacterized membrane protein